MAAKEQEQSMEDILQSIKRIIAEEGDAELGSEMAESKTQGKPQPRTKSESQPASVAPASGAGSDILELTDIIPAEATESPSTFSVEEVMAIPRAQSMSSGSDDSQSLGARSQGGIVSDDTVISAAASLRSLDRVSDNIATRHDPIASMPLRSGMTVEDLVIEALRPMLRSWLDANLPQLVERLVDREIRRISATSR
jgi:cell pole-organizing protein PopZ